MSRSPLPASVLALLLLGVACASPPAGAPSPANASSARQMERLGRGLVAVHQGNGRVFVSWRLLATDQGGVAFNLYRIVGDAAPVRVNAAPLTEATSASDSIYVSAPVAYLVRPVVNGGELAPSERYVLRRETPYLSLRLRTPDGYTPNDGAVGDLDGDGEYDLVVHQVGRGRDNSQRGVTTNPVLEAYRLDGTFLWRIDLGKNVREGAHYTQFIVYDLDGDGRAEVACKTADGTIDGMGKVIGNANADHRNANGFIAKGPEFLTVFDGRTGAALATTRFIPARPPLTDAPTSEQQRAVWGDSNYNRMDRFLAGVAYLDGVHPSLIMTRGYYTRAVLTAWDWRDGNLTSRWVFDSAAGGTGKDGKPHHDYGGMGAHSLSVADVDHERELRQGRRPLHPVWSGGIQRSRHVSWRRCQSRQHQFFPGSFRLRQLQSGALRFCAWAQFHPVRHGLRRGIGQRALQGGPHRQGHPRSLHPRRLV